MKKSISTFLTLACFGVFLLLPIIFGLHAMTMTHHTMDVSDCIEHCLESQGDMDTSKIVMIFSYTEIFVEKILFTQIFIFALPLALLFLLRINDPPNRYRPIKNYDYAALTGIILHRT